MENDQPLPPSQPQQVSWTASEFIAHEKSASWYLGLVVIALAVAAVIFLATKDAVSVAVVIVAGLLLGVYGSRQPRQLEYVIDHHTLSVGQKHYLLSEFRSFSVVPEGAFSSIVFMPLKRFSPPLSIYYAPPDEAQIVEVLSQQLPMDPPHRDIVENLMRRIRF